MFGEDELTPNMSDEQKQRIRMHYKRTFLDYDPRQGMSELIQDGINRNPDMKPIKKNSRISLKDTQIGTLTNQITFVSKAIMRLTKLQALFSLIRLLLKMPSQPDGLTRIPSMPNSI